MRWTFRTIRSNAVCALRSWCAAWLLLAAVAAAGWPVMVTAQTVPEVQSFEVTRGDDGVNVAFALSFDLPRAVEDALYKGVPLYFVAQVELIRERWYWRDKRIALAERTWRLAFQPLSRKFRVSFGGLNQSYDSLTDALVAVRRVTSWRVADAAALDDGGGHYIEFSYRLDTSLLPRPLQIGLGGQADWNLRVEKYHRID
ncbi:MAG: DUF4390 domain-containing protein [Ideonella sp.]